MCNDSEDVLYPDIFKKAVNITRISRDYTSAANVKIREGRELEKHSDSAGQAFLISPYAVTDTQNGKIQNIARM